MACVTAGGSIDTAHPVFEEGAIVLTTEAAAVRLRASVPAATEVVAVNGGDRVDLQLGLDSLRGRGHSLILSEAGPTLFGSLRRGGTRGRAVPDGVAAARGAGRDAAAGARRRARVAAGPRASLAPPLGAAAREPRLPPLRAALSRELRPSAESPGSGRESRWSFPPAPGRARSGRPGSVPAAAA